MILLGFDVEEFDMPMEYGATIPFDEQMALSVEGAERILELLDRREVKATFYVTANFALHAPQIVRQIVAGGHELASHGLYHDRFEASHPAESKRILEETGGVAVDGYRMARMMDLPEEEVRRAGYVYNSSINPTFIPGRYNRWREPRRCFMREGVWQLPASVTPWLRIPLFWLSFHNFPLRFYMWLARRTIRRDGYLNVYFHPWEFIALREDKRFRLPFYVTRNSGRKMVERMERLILWAKKRDYGFGLTREFINRQQALKTDI
jgi:peptidoglycan/xylan/chitin deacetylase (PgdA/CDA1 family)